MPYIDFTAGQVLTESQLDTMFRQTTMTFASASARDTALAGVLTAGMVTFQTDTNRTTVYDGVSWQVVSSPWAAYTPSLVNASNGNGTLSFRYRYAGWKTIQVRGQWLLGTTSAITGLVGFGYPDSVTPALVRSLGVAWLEDNTGADFIGACQSASSIFVYSPGITPTSATSPFTWADADGITVDITFEIT
jgi:hypothetical protein